MRKATTRDVPSQVTREQIRRAIDSGTRAARAVDRFHGVARRASAMFGAEVHPLHLADDVFERVVIDSGLRRVDDLALRIEQVALAIQADPS